MRWMKIAVVVLVAFCAPLTRAADNIVALSTLKLPALFGDNMVLQQGINCPVWGWATPGQTVTVSFMEQKKQATANQDGKWIVRLDPVKAGGPHTLTIAADTTRQIQNVLVGEVWICSGQSNMEWTMRAVGPRGEDAVKQSANPKIRLFTVKKNPSEKPLNDVTGNWQLASPETVPNFSAVGYFFGRELQKALDVPVGLIHTSWGGTAIELWMSKENLESDPQTRVAIEQHEQRMQQYQAALKQYEEKSAQAKAEGKTAPQPPRAPMGPAVLYNGMVAPLVPYGIAGATWYQGESNAGSAELYRKQLPAMIGQWRKEFGLEFPFLVVQLANFMDRKDQPTDTNWARLREAQSNTAATYPKTGLAVAIDIGEAKDIHPKNKEDVGKRLALSALKIAYGKDIVYSGPVFDSMTVEGDKARLKFKNVGGGLVAKDGEALKGFAVAGENKKFVWADAKIEGDAVVLSSKEVAKPLAVRYGWADNPEVNLYNKEGLPAVPFRSDDWPR